MGHMLIAALLAGAGGAQAAAPVASVAIDNDFDAAVKVYVGSDYVGTVGGDQDRTFRVRAGLQPIRVMHGDDSLLSTTVRLLPGTTAHLDVHAPTVAVELFNRGDRPVFVQLGGQATWIGPHQDRTLQVRAGERDVQTWTASYRGGMREVESFEVFLRPDDRRQRIVVSDTALPGTLVVTNHERRDLMLYVDGVARGTVDGGEHLELALDAGSARVLLVSRDGALRIHDTVELSRGERAELQIGTPSYAGGRPVCMR